MPTTLKACGLFIGKVFDIINNNVLMRCFRNEDKNI